MKPYVQLLVLIGGVAALLLACTAQAHAGVLSLKDGRWRYEIQGMHGTNIGGGDHNDDAYIVGEIEYEMPAYRRWALGLKAVPLFVLNQHDNDTGDH